MTTYEGRMPWWSSGACATKDVEEEHGARNPRKVMSIIHVGILPKCAPEQLRYSSERVRQLPLIGKAQKLLWTSEGLDAQRKSQSDDPTSGMPSEAETANGDQDADEDDPASVVWEEESRHVWRRLSAEAKGLGRFPAESSMPPPIEPSGEDVSKSTSVSEATSLASLETEQSTSKEIQGTPWLIRANISRSFLFDGSDRQFFATEMFRELSWTARGKSTTETLNGSEHEQSIERRTPTSGSDKTVRNVSVLAERSDARAQGPRFRSLARLCKARFRSVIATQE